MLSLVGDFINWYNISKRVIDKGIEDMYRIKYICQILYKLLVCYRKINC